MRVNDSYLVVSLARMAVFRSVRKVAIKGGRTGPVEFHRTRRAGTHEEKRIDWNIVINSLDNEIKPNWRSKVNGEDNQPERRKIPTGLCAPSVDSRFSQRP
jgi:hypothetical protein